MKNGLTLFPYQVQGVQFLASHGSGLLADEVGLGKTVQTLALIDQTRPARVLVLCPAILKYQWQEEVKRFLPGISVVVVDGDQAARHDAWKRHGGIHIANYELLLRDLEMIELVAWDIIVADEATRIANPWTKTYRALRKLNARSRIALTGTPISNKPQEIWGILNWCFPGVLGKYVVFLDRYCIRNQWGGIFGYQRLEELQQRIAPYLIRRTKEEVYPELPAKIISEIPFKLNAREQDLYRRIRAELLLEIEKEEIAKVENPISIQNALVKLLRLKQCADHLALLGDYRDSTKLSVLKELLPDALGEKRKAIVFTQFSKMADILERELGEWRPLKITGDVNKKDAIVALFNTDVDHRVLIMTAAGQYGLNLQAASVIVHYDLEWSIGKLEQREGRAHRIGQNEKVYAYHLLAKGTIDMYVRRVLLEKQKMANTLLSAAPITAQDVHDMLSYGTEKEVDA